ncbi:MAG: 4-(cytidine 5'-diphospho)-2-C-methyl-D-erythritol kinase [Caldimicrobium sp.]|nr:4-(cytidine 5'-diphospho)-2-C-methyl-D-erythritol kinase [Caldimicrobium sp.]MCX7873518.1 4-(cytidine 5'-diphospho)-2-C-methyl-D-erythritol kinase [Caldimicrobium sp.]MDW8093844.1 4-(cytidine 5'-diphospho)-2-C-methyl-D-erythritol kinase [Caldimicrobium sp.]
MWLISPAKVNLFLQVLSKRPDNYHEIYTLFQKITLFDEIELKVKQREFTLKFESEEEIPLERNLIYKAWRLFKERFSLKEEIKIWVRKRIPVGAGLGGGSSNAGTLLRALSKFYEVEEKEVFALALKLGADVPFFLSDLPCALATGIGEVLTPFPNFDAYYVLIYPNFKVETAWAYQNLNLTKSKNPVYYETSLPPWETPQGLINDFRDLIYKKFYPLYDNIERLLFEEGAKAVSLSGTGSTIYGVFENPPFEGLLRLKNSLKNVKIYLAKNLEC